MIKLVFDTSILIDHLRNGIVWRNILAQLKQDTKLFLPTIVIFELYSGKSSKNAEVVKKITNLIKQFQRIELTEKISQRAGELYRDINKNFQVPDYLIAASALEIQGTVLTLNKKHFEQIANLKLYPL